MGKAVKINITLPEEELRRVDAFVQRQKDTRSGLIQEALRSFIEQKQKEEKEKEKRERMIKAASEIRQLREKSGEWDGVAEIRKWREAR
jgi:Ribbon-helix-helix protein, copG family.